MEIDKEFLKETFKETNSHIRATDRKSLAVSGAFIGLFSVYLSSIAHGRWGATAVEALAVQIAAQCFFLFVGICVYIMQQWYRAWKEHYIEVCLNIRRHFLPEADYPGLLPYWLRHESRDSRMSIDNVLKYLTGVVNLVLLFILSYDVLEIITNHNLAILVVVALVCAFVAVIYFADRNIQKKRTLFA